MFNTRHQLKLTKINHANNHAEFLRKLISIGDEMFELTYICFSLIDGGPFGGSCQIHGPASHATVGSLLSGDSEEVISINESSYQHFH